MTLERICKFAYNLRAFSKNSKHLTKKLYHDSFYILFQKKISNNLSGILKQFYHVIGLLFYSFSYSTSSSSYFNYSISQYTAPLPIFELIFVFFIHFRAIEILSSSFGEMICACISMKLDSNNSRINSKKNEILLQRNPCLFSISFFVLVLFCICFTIFFPAYNSKHIHNFLFKYYSFSILCFFHFYSLL